MHSPTQSLNSVAAAGILVQLREVDTLLEKTSRANIRDTLDIHRLVRENTASLWAVYVCMRMWVHSGLISQGAQEIKDLIQQQYLQSPALWGADVVQNANDVRQPLFIYDAWLRRRDVRRMRNSY